MTTETILVPNIGGASNVEVIEILVKPGDIISQDTSLLTLEGDKATMEVPSPKAGKISKILVKVGDKISEGSAIIELEPTEAESATMDGNAKKITEAAVEKTPATPSNLSPIPDVKEAVSQQDDAITSHAGPAVRRLAQEIGLDLAKIPATGEKGRVLKEDIQRYVQAQFRLAENGGGLAVSAAPTIDFSLFGNTEVKPLSRIQKISGANLHRNWVSIPHVTQFGAADITELEAFRQAHKNIEFEKQSIRLTPLVFIMKAIVATLKEFPRFNASLDSTGENLIFKKYFNLGVAVDTPSGLVVPVIKDVDKKGILELAKELAVISEKARVKGLSLTDMQGGCFSISSLGGIGGTAFTPIINAPEVAILGVSQSQLQPIFNADQNTFIPRLMLPLSLSYDHRVIDGAEAARFLVYLMSRLSDIRTLLL